MGCAGIGRTGKPDSVTFDAETVSFPAFDENTTVLSGTIVHEPTVEIDAREAVFSIRDAGALEGVLDIDPQTGAVTFLAAMVLIQSPWALAMIRWSCALILIVIHQVHGAWMMAAM